MRDNIIARLQEKMLSQGIDFMLIRSADEFFNEYVPAHLSRRQAITGFTGSVGDALIGKQGAWLFVDGRYGLQAKEEARGFTVVVQPIGQSIEEGWVECLSSQPNIKSAVLGFETDRISHNLMLKIKSQNGLAKTKIIHLDAAFFSELTGGRSSDDKASEIWKVPAKWTGRTFVKRLSECQKAIAACDLDAMVITPLDTIAWLTQLRGDEYKHQSIFSARALLHPKGLLLATENGGQIKLGEFAQIVPLREFESAAAKLKGLNRVGFDPANTSVQMQKSLKRAGLKLIAAQSPLEEMKSIKTSEELLHMRSGFHRADRVVSKTIKWTQGRVAKGTQTSEADVAKYLHRAYLDSGARDLSFGSICGADENGAIIHYSKASAQKMLKPGTMFLMDSGGIYEGGYATDLTRTFFCGGTGIQPSIKQKHIFTTVLRGAIAGMTAKFPKGTNGTQLDAIVRAPIWQAGYNFAHGTGHGVGINVHEFPPTISSRVKTEIKVGQVFSIEPGIYLEGFGGVRIENLCTAIEDSEDKSFLQVVPLTFSPLDEQLIDTKSLTASEKNFLKYYREGFRLGPDVVPSPMI